MTTTLVERLREGTFGSDEAKTDPVINAYMRQAATRIEELERQLAERNAEIARYKASPTVEACRQMIEAQAVKENEALYKQIALLREVLEMCDPHPMASKKYAEALATFKGEK